MSEKNVETMTEEDAAKLEHMAESMEALLGDSDMIARMRMIVGIGADNPAIMFTDRARNGHYDEMSDNDYNALLDECEQTSAFWHNKKEINCVIAGHGGALEALLSCAVTMEGILSEILTAAEAEKRAEAFRKLADDMELKAITEKYGTQTGTVAPEDELIEDDPTEFGED